MEEDTQRLRVALAIIVIRSRRPFEDNRRTILRILEVIRGTIMAERLIIEGVKVVSSLIGPLLASEPTPIPITSLLAAFHADKLTTNLTGLLLQNRSYTDEEAAVLITFARQRPVERIPDDVLQTLLIGPSATILIRVACLLPGIRDVGPETLQQLLRHLESEDPILVIVGATIIQHLRLADADLVQIRSRLQGTRRFYL
ncbi:hypothetical protein GMRT_11257 [Giardia muris]|uniref:Uncharacterized protein n=1 Tax=Giardia muris TaxID=5742 RepID=A0A4Z1SXR9_GIAMU|nr:hypothetical protein GMRT_11257 [Giardia muris]|eukprot:TNJ28318.1 hypothetical protein GMRT_11257 [Giardia muris]